MIQSLRGRLLLGLLALMVAGLIVADVGTYLSLQGFLMDRVDPASVETGARHPRDLSRQNDVFFRPGMDLAAMRTSHLMTFDFCLLPQFFPDGLTARRQLRGGRAADEKTLNARA